MICCIPHGMCIEVIRIESRLYETALPGGLNANWLANRDLLYNNNAMCYCTLAVCSCSLLVIVCCFFSLVC